MATVPNDIKQWFKDLRSALQTKLGDRFNEKSFTNWYKKEASQQFRDHLKALVRGEDVNVEEVESFFERMATKGAGGTPAELKTGTAPSTPSLATAPTKTSSPILDAQGRNFEATEVAEGVVEEAVSKKRVGVDPEVGAKKRIKEVRNPRTSKKAADKAFSSFMHHARRAKVPAPALEALQKIVVKQGGPKAFLATVGFANAGEVLANAPKDSFIVRQVRQALGKDVNTGVEGAKELKSLLEGSLEGATGRGAAQDINKGLGAQGAMRRVGREAGVAGFEGGLKGGIKTALTGARRLGIGTALGVAGAAYDAYLVGDLLTGGAQRQAEETGGVLLSATPTTKQQFKLLATQVGTLQRRKASLAGDPQLLGQLIEILGGAGATGPSGLPAGSVAIGKNAAKYQREDQKQSQDQIEQRLEQLLSSL